MVARRRLWQATRELGFGLGLLLFYAVALPWLVTFLGLGERWVWLAPVRNWGLRFLYVAPVLFGVLLVVRWRQMVTKHRRLQRELEQEGESFYLLPRADAPAARADRVSLWSHVGEILPRDAHLSFEVCGGAAGVRFVCRATPGVDRALITQIMAEWPGTLARPVAPQDDPLLAGDRASWWCEVRPAFADRPLVAVADDPLLSALAELSRLPGGVSAGLQVVVRGDPYARRHVGKKAMKQASKVNNYTTLEQNRRIKELDARAQGTFIEVQVVTWATAGSEEMARSVARSLARAVSSQYGPANPLKQVGEGIGAPGRRAFPLWGGRPWTGQELGTLAHLVGQDARAIVPQLLSAPANPLPPAPGSILPGRGVRTSPRLRQPESPEEGMQIEGDELTVLTPEAAL